MSDELVDSNALILEEVECLQGWHLAILRVSEFPMPPDELDPIRKFVDSFVAQLKPVANQHHELFLALWRLRSDTGADILSDNVEDWSPDFGLGVWPDRLPPQGWTENMMSDAAASMFTNEEPALPSHRLLRLAPKIEAVASVASKLRGLGTLIEAFSHTKWDQLQTETKDLYLPTINERRFRSEDFYFPVLDLASIRASSTDEQLKRWLCGIDIYIRESPEDQAILILSKSPVTSDARVSQEF